MSKTMRPNPRPRLRRNRAEDASFRTDTPAFRRWFGDSKVVDERGAPLVVYHGTGKAFTVFDPSRLGEQTGAGNTAMGFFFTDDYGLARELYAGRRGEVMEVYLSIQKPLRIRDTDDNDMGRALRLVARDYLDRDPETAEDWRAFRDYLREMRDIDGVEFVGNAGDPRYEMRVYLAFEPTQIKSSTENVGTFDPEDTDIRRNPRRRLRRNTLAVQLREGHPSLRRTKAFVQEWHDRDMDRVFADMGARVDVSVGSGDAHDAVSLDSLEALTYRKGAGSRALRALLDLTDKHGLTVTLTAEPFSVRAFPDPDLISRDALVRFYKRFGFDFDESEGSPEWFEDEDEGYYPMVRYPRTSNPRGR